MVQQLSVQELYQWLEQNREKPIILDVREPWECQICSLPDAIYIPMGAVPSRYLELDQNRDIVVLCHHGIRSFRVANYLKAQGFEKLFNLKGGINAWATDVDADLATY